MFFRNHLESVIYMRYVYLHGFASSPQSRKARAFSDSLADCGIKVEIPDLSQGDFAHLTVSRQLQVIENTLHGEPCRLVGSSMGGYLASLYAASHPEVERLVLLAPAFGLVDRWREMQGVEAIRRWRETGWQEVFHYGDKAMRRIHYGLLEDAENFPGFPDFHQPALVFHGVDDSVVGVDLSRIFVRSHPNVQLREVPSDHELLNVLDAITTDAIAYLIA